MEIGGRDLILAAQAAVILIGSSGVALERKSVNAEVDAEFAGLQSICEQQLQSANEQIKQCRTQLQECWETKVSSRGIDANDSIALDALDADVPHWEDDNITLYEGGDIDAG